MHHALTVEDGYNLTMRIIMLFVCIGARNCPRSISRGFKKREDTFAHGTVDIILKHFFPENTLIVLNWRIEHGRQSTRNVE